MTTADVEAGLRLCRESHWNQIARDWEQFLRLDAHGVTVAERGGQVIGSVATVRYEPQLAWIAMVLVAPHARGQGIGMALLHRGLETVADVHTVGLDATPAGQPLYEKLGFVVDTTFTRMERVDGPVRRTRAGQVWRGAGQVRRLHLPPAVDGGMDETRVARPADLPGMHVLDTRASGVNRRVMLEWLAAGAPEFARVSHDPAQGFVLGRHGHTFDHLGPLAATDQGRARRLVRRCLHDNPGRRVIIDIADAQPGWREALETIGFTAQRPFARMYRGTTRPRTDATTLFASIGPEFG